MEEEAGAGAKMCFFVVVDDEGGFGVGVGCSIFVVVVVV